MLKTIVTLLSCGGLLAMTAAPVSIGFVKSNGEFRIDGSGIRGNGTIFDGNVIETLAARSTVQVADTQLVLLPESRAKVYRDRIVLEKGSGLAANLAHRTIDVGSLQVASTDSQQTQLQIEFNSPRRIVVSAMAGAAAVRNSAGMLVANVTPGMALAFDPEPGGAPGSVDMSGTVEARDGKYFLKDQTTHVKVELEGDGLQQYAGKNVEITGTVVQGATPAGGASEVVKVASTKVLTKAAGHAAPASAGAGTGLSHGAIGAIVGGVAVAGTVGGLAAAGTFSGGQSPVSR